MCTVFSSYSTDHFSAAMLREPGDEASVYYSTDNLNPKWEELKTLPLFDARLLDQYEMNIIAAR